jgi:biofilm PGA synthesis N-glycosyltransferase PgaC
MLFLPLIIYLVLLFSLWIGWRLWFGKVLQPEPQAISIVIPVRNEATSLSGLFHAIYHQDYPTQLMEILVVNDHSNDDSKKVFELLAADLPLIKMKWIDLPDHQSGKKAALTWGIQNSLNDFIVVTDADCLPDSKWLHRLLAPFKLPEKQLSIGYVGFQDKTPETFLHAFQTYDFHAMMAVAGGVLGLGGALASSGANMAFRKNAFLEIQGYRHHEHLASGDDVFLLHAIKSRWPSGVAYCPESLVHTQTAPDWGTFFKQRLRWGGKATHYSRPDAILLTLLIWLANGLLTATIPVYLFGMLSIKDLMLIWVIKIAVDAAFLFATDHHQLLKSFWYLPVALCYAPYLFLTGLFAPLLKSEWKGR